MSARGSCNGRSRDPLEERRRRRRRRARLPRRRDVAGAGAPLPCTGRCNCRLSLGVSIPPPRGGNGGQRAGVSVLMPRSPQLELPAQLRDLKPRRRRLPGRPVPYRTAPPAPAPAPPQLRRSLQLRARAAQVRGRRLGAASPRPGHAPATGVKQAGGCAGRDAASADLGPKLLAAPWETSVVCKGRGGGGEPFQAPPRRAPRLQDKAPPRLPWGCGDPLAAAPPAMPGESGGGPRASGAVH